MRDLEYKDIKSVKDLFENYSEVRIARMLNFPEARELAKELLNQRYRYETDAIHALKQHYTLEMPDPEAPVCDCPPANGLRWETFPVSWSYSAYRQPVNGSAQVVRSIFREIQTLCGITFLETAEADANIVIKNGQIDGPGSTLGQAYQPATGDRMAACGEMCGDILIDVDEFWSLDMFRTIMMHEVLHALGLRHSTDTRSIMFPRYLGPREIHAVDIAELLRRYPMEVAA